MYCYCHIRKRLSLLTDISKTAKLLYYRLDLCFNILPWLPRGPQQHLSSLQICCPAPSFSHLPTSFPLTVLSKKTSPDCSNIYHCAHTGYIPSVNRANAMWYGSYIGIFTGETEVKASQGCLIHESSSSLRIQTFL